MGTAATDDRATARDRVSSAYEAKACIVTQLNRNSLSSSISKK